MVPRLMERRSVSTILAPEVPFVPVARSYMWASALTWGLSLLAFLLLGLAGRYLWELTWLQAIAAGGSAVCLLSGITSVRAARATGYFLGERGLWLAKGRLTRSLDIIGYGRIQEVSLSAGPILRSFGLAALTVHTASATSDGEIPGLRLADAHELRDRLTALGSEAMEGL